MPTDIGIRTDKSAPSPAPHYGKSSACAPSPTASGRPPTRAPTERQRKLAHSTGRRARADRGSACPQGAHFHFASGFSSPLDSRTCWTPWSVFQDGSGGLPIPLTSREAPQGGLLAVTAGQAQSVPQPVITSAEAQATSPARPSGSAQRVATTATRGRTKPAGLRTTGTGPRQLTFTPGPHVEFSRTAPAAENRPAESPLSTFTVPPVWASNGFTSS